MCTSVPESKEGRKSLQRAARAIRKVYADTDVDIQEAVQRGEEPVMDISVSLDGTWQKRGFISLYGVRVCIEDMTDLLIDNEVLSKYCHA